MPRRRSRWRRPVSRSFSGSDRKDWSGGRRGADSNATTASRTEAAFTTPAAGIEPQSDEPQERLDGRLRRAPIHVGAATAIPCSHHRVSCPVVPEKMERAIPAVIEQSLTPQAFMPEGVALPGFLGLALRTPGTRLPSSCGLMNGGLCSHSLQISSKIRSQPTAFVER